MSPIMPDGLVDDPMKSHQRILSEETGTGLFQYFIKVIPTKYKSAFGDISTNQYTVTEKFRPLKSLNDKGEVV